MTVTVTVSGPGGVISFELYVIKYALERYGVKVEVVDDAPPKDPELVIAEIARRIREWGTKKHVRIVANHIPWGG